MQFFRAQNFLFFAAIFSAQFLLAVEEPDYRFIEVPKVGSDIEESADPEAMTGSIQGEVQTPQESKKIRRGPASVKKLRKKKTTAAKNQKSKSLKKSKKSKKRTP